MFLWPSRTPGTDDVRTVEPWIADQQSMLPLAARQDHVLFKAVRLDSETCDVDASD